MRRTLQKDGSAMACNLCGDNNFETVSTRSRRGEPLKTALCRTCGLIAHAKIPDEAELERYYAEDYRLDYHGELTPSPHRVLRAWRNGRRILEQVRSHLPDSAKVFEIGAGIGCTVKQFELAGFDARGIEPNKGFHKYSREQLRTRVEIGDWAALQATPAFDAILLIHVIEHLRDPFAALGHIRQLLPDGGLFYVECPNFAAPHAAPGNQFHYAHIFNFTPTTLAMLAARSGFELVQRFGSGSDANLQMLFRKSEPRPLTIDPHGLREARAALAFNWLSYHFRPSYLIERVRKLSGYAWDRIVARRRVREILDQCRQSPEAESADRLRRAA